MDEKRGAEARKIQEEALMWDRYGTSLRPEEDYSKITPNIKHALIKQCIFYFSLLLVPKANFSQKDDDQSD